jgi:hypothetical protein
MSTNLNYLLLTRFWLYYYYHKKREIDECNALGMTATVSQTTELLSLNRRNICDDKAVIDELLNETRKMVDDVVSTLELYTTSKNPEITGELSDRHKSLLGSICVAISTIGVNDECRLDGFLRGDLDYKVEAMLSTSVSVAEMTDADETSGDSEIETTDLTNEEEQVDTFQQLKRSRRSPVVFKAKIVGRTSSSSFSLGDYTTEEESVEDSQPGDDHPRNVTTETITEEPIDIEATEVASEELKVSSQELDATKVTMKAPAALSTSAPWGTTKPLSKKFTWATNKPEHQARSFLEIQQEEIASKCGS